MGSNTRTRTTGTWCQHFCVLTVIVCSVLAAVTVCCVLLLTFGLMLTRVGPPAAGPPAGCAAGPPASETERLLF